MMGSYHPACFFLAQPLPAEESIQGAWSHTSPFTGLVFPLLHRDSATPLARVEDIEGFSSLSEAEKKQVREASQLKPTGAGTKRKRSPTRAKAKKEAAGDSDSSAKAEASASRKKQAASAKKPAVKRQKAKQEE